jgi:MYXO-CTERM domain-containing protein
MWTMDMEDPDFGWIDIGWDGDTLTIYDWAINTNGSIHVGQTTTAVPGATGLAALAMGAAGLRRRRKRAA